MTDATKVPSEAESLEALHELIGVWDDATHESLTVPVMDNHWHRAASVWVQADHAIALARSVEVLWQQGMRLQCVPLLRLILECGVTGAWLARTDGSSDASVAEYTRLHVALVKGVRAMAGAEHDPDLDVMLAEAKQGATDEAKWIEARCKALDGGAWMYTYYRLLSKYSHGGAGLMDAYVRQGEPEVNGGGPYRGDPQTFDGANIMLATSVVFLHTAMTAWASIDPEHQSGDVLAEFGTAHGMSATLWADRQREMDAH